MQQSPIENFFILGDTTYIKREDLIGGLFNGTKNRKIDPIIEKIKKTKPKKIILKGSLYSNFLIAFSSKLKNLSIPFAIYTKAKYKPNSLVGNYFFLDLFIENKDINFVEEYPKEFPVDYFIVEEGGDCLEAYVGLLTLGEEINEYMLKTNHFFTDIWIDAGTGTSAICLLYSLRKLNLHIKLHIVSMKDSFIEFNNKKKIIFNTLNKELNEDINIDIDFEFYHPITAKSFGSTNKKIFQTIREVAFLTGILLDPIYSAKLFLTAKQSNIKGNILFIHSGGTLALTGFTDQLKESKDRAFCSNS